MKTSADSTLVFPLASLSHKDVALCHNLRPAGDSLEPVGPPMPFGIPAIPGARLLPGGAQRVDERNYIFLEQEGNLICSSRYKTQTLVPDSGTPCAILRQGDDIFVMMGEGEAPMRLILEKEMWSWTGVAELPAPLCVILMPADVVSARVEGVKLRGEYSSRSTGLLPVDIEAVSKAVAKAYCAIGDSVAARHCYFQPVMVRYRLRGHDDSILYVSPPEIVAPDCGRQFTSCTLTLGGEGFSQTEAASVSVRSFNLRLGSLVMLRSGWHKAVKCAELLVSPQLHTLDEDFRSECRFGSFTAVSGQLEVTVPGTVADDDEALSSRVEALLARVDEALEPAATATYNSSLQRWEPVADIVAGAPFRNTRGEIAALRALLRRPVEVPSGSDAAIAALSMPHCLSAGIVGVGGDCVALGSLSARRFGGWLPGEFAIGADTGPAASAIPMACKVTFADGSSSVRSGVADRFSVPTLSPLLLYPSADAVKLELYCADSSLSVDLAPDPSGRFAYSFAPGGRPRAMTRDKPAFILPTASPAPRRFPGMVAVSRASDPLTPTAVTRVTESRMTTLCAAPTSSGGWDAGSARFYLFGQGGIHALTVNSARRVLTARVLDSRPVEGADAVCPIGSGGIAVAAGEDILRLSGQRVSVISSFVGCHRLGWNPAKDELLCFHSPDRPCPANLSIISGSQTLPLNPEVTVIRPADGAIFTRSAPTVTSVCSDSRSLLVTDSAGHVYDLAAEQPDAQAEVHYRSRIPAGRHGPARRLLPLPLAGTVGEGRAELRAYNGCGEERSDCIASFGLEGDFVHLPPSPVLTPHRHGFILSLGLKVCQRNFRLRYAS